MNDRLFTTPRGSLHSPRPQFVRDLGREAAWELAKAASRFPMFNSPHEGWAVIKEELDELWEHVRANTGTGQEARNEAIQVAEEYKRAKAEADRLNEEESSAVRWLIADAIKTDEECAKRARTEIALRSASG